MSKISRCIRLYFAFYYWCFFKIYFESDAFNLKCIVSDVDVSIV